MGASTTYMKLYNDGVSKITGSGDVTITSSDDVTVEASDYITLSAGENLFIKSITNNIICRHGNGDYLSIGDQVSTGIYLKWNNSSSRLEADEDLYMPLDNITCDKITYDSADPPVLVDGKIYISSIAESPTCTTLLSGVYSSTDKMVVFPLDYKQYPKGSDEFLFFSMTSNVRLVATPLDSLNETYYTALPDRLIVHLKRDGMVSILLSGERCDSFRDNHLPQVEYKSALDVKSKRIAHLIDGEWTPKEEAKRIRRERKEANSLTSEGSEIPERV